MSWQFRLDPAGSGRETKQTEFKCDYFLHGSAEHVRLRSILPANKRIFRSKRDDQQRRMKRESHLIWISWNKSKAWPGNGISYEWTFECFRRSQLKRLRLHDVSQNFAAAMQRQILGHSKKHPSYHLPDDDVGGRRKETRTKKQRFISHCWSSRRFLSLSLSLSNAHTQTRKRKTVQRRQPKTKIRYFAVETIFPVIFPSLLFLPSLVVTIFLFLKHETNWVDWTLSI